jgi:hypothetical protein
VVDGVQAEAHDVELTRDWDVDSEQQHRPPDGGTAGTAAA